MTPNYIRQSTRVFIAQFVLFAVAMGMFGQVATAQKIGRVATEPIVSDQKEFSSEEKETETSCQDTYIYTTGNDAADGTNGVVRTFSAGSYSVRASAWSRRKSDNLWRDAYLGRFESGIGVTDRNEQSSEHRVDNGGNDYNYVLYEFNKPVIVDQVYLDAVSGDSDIHVWIGNATDPYNNHLTLSSALLTSFGSAESNDGGNGARFANINNSNKVGNVMVVAARVDQSNDAFKIRKVVVDCAPSNKGRVEIVKEVFTFDGLNGSSAAFTFNATGLGVSSFNLVDNNVVGPDRYINPSVNAGSTITIDEVPAFGWSFVEVQCTETGQQNSVWSEIDSKVMLKVEAGETVRCVYRNGLAVPSAAGATVSGRAFSDGGTPVRDAVLTLLDVQTGETRSVRTNSFGVYSFTDVEVSRFYVLTISHRRHSFADATRAFTLMENLDNMDFVEAF